MPRNKMTDLRNHLFETLEKLQDGDIELKTAKAICDIGQVLVNSAKVEADYIKAVGGRATGFIDVNNDQPKLNHPTPEKKKGLPLFGTREEE